MILDATKALITQLKTNSDLAGLTWYSGLALPNFTYPYGIVLFNSGGADNTYKTNLADLFMLVQVVGTDSTQTRQLGGLIYDVLHEAEIGLVDTWYVWRMQMDQAIDLLEIDADLRIRRSGGIFRIRMSK